MKLGIDRLTSYLHIFENKRVGLITNPTGVNSKLELTPEVLKKHVNLKVLFAPEHGIRGDKEAGVHVDSYFDEKLELTVHSLYGKNKKPSKELLEDIDILAFDMQDVGLRFYTYIYTMAYAMMAAAENNIEFVVFDRPNPLGSTIEGSLLDINYRSFVGYYDIPQRYGLTIGELALLFNEYYGIQAKLTVVPMEDYKRDSYFDDYKLPWLAPSPNLPTLNSVFAYAGTCIFEGTNVSEGRGTTRPFQLIGAPFVDAEDLTEKVRALNVPGILVRPAYFVPSFSKHQGETCRGIEIFITDRKAFEPVQFGYQLLRLISEYDGFEFRAPFKEGMHPMIDLLTGSNQLRMGESLDKLFNDFKEGTEKFKEISKRYHLYE